MMDYAQWMNRAIAFVESLRDFPGVAKIEIEVAPPLSDAEIDELGRNCRLPIPDSLRQFWRQASGHCNAKYWLDTPDDFREQMKVAFPKWSGSYFWGGPEFESSSDMAAWTYDFTLLANQFKEEFPRDARLWEHTIPLIRESNGDCIGLYVRDDATNPPVVYLCKDGYGASRIIDSCLDDFLLHWERLGYLGINFLTSFLRPESELLEPEAFPVQAEAARALLRGELRPALVTPAIVMTENDWADSNSPETLLEWLERDGELDSRKVRLFDCACCRRLWDRMSNSHQEAVEVVERFADGLESEEMLESVQDGLPWKSEQTPTPTLLPFPTIGHIVGRPDPMHGAVYSALRGRTHTTWEITNHLDEPELSAEKAAQADLIRHIFGNPFRPAETICITDPSIRQLAENIYEGQPLAAELKAALLGAGHDELAAHFDRLDHPKGCWALDAIRG